jgi:hypothetical protein
MMMFLSIAALVAAKLLLPLLLAVGAAARAVASIITHDPKLTVTPAKAGAQLYRRQKSRVPAFAGMTKSDWVFKCGTTAKTEKRRLFIWILASGFVYVQTNQITVAQDAPITPSPHRNEIVLSTHEITVLQAATQQFLVKGHLLRDYEKVYMERQEDRLVITFLSRHHTSEIYDGVPKGLPLDVVFVLRNNEKSFREP